MNKSDLSVLLVGAPTLCPDIAYATGFHANDAVVFLQKGKRQYLVVPELEYGRAVRVADRTQILTPSLLGLNATRRRRLSFWVIALLKAERIRSVRVPSIFPHGVACALQHSGIRVAVEPSRVFPQRAVKKPDEVKKIKECQEAAVVAVRAAVSLIAESTVDRKGRLQVRGRALTSESIRALIARQLLERECFCGDSIVACGADAADPHEKGSGPLLGGKSIVIDVFPRSMAHGYWGDLTRTVIKGTASARLHDMYQAVRAAQHAALEKLRPGVKCKTVQQAAADEFVARGFETSFSGERPTGFIHSVGHGIGLEVHEAPAVATVDTRLKSGNVITIEPGLYYPGIGGIRIEDTVLITSSGWRYLASCEKRFEV